MKTVQWKSHNGKVGFAYRKVADKSCEIYHHTPITGEYLMYQPIRFVGWEDVVKSLGMMYPDECMFFLGDILFVDYQVGVWTYTLVDL